MHKTTTELIKNKISPSFIISRKVKLTKKGLNFWGLCPFHSEKTPSFSVNDSKKIYHCFGCTASGDIFTFLMETEGKSFTTVLEELALMAGIPIKEKAFISNNNPFQELLELTQKWCEEQLHNAVGFKALNYLSKRISLSSIKDFNLGYCPSEGLKQHLQQSIKNDSLLVASGVFNKFGKCLFANRVIFPIYNPFSILVGFGGRILTEDNLSPKYINSHETEFFKKGKLLYGLRNNYTAYKRGIIVVEGYLDVIAMHQAGFKNTVGILGTALTEDHLQVLLALTNQVTLCLDGDEGGIGATHRIIRMSLSILSPVDYTKIKFIFLPYNHDPYEVLKKDALTMLKLIESALPISEAIWYLLTKDKIFSSPEDQMLLKNKLQEEVSFIPDKALSKKYFYYLNRKISSLFFQGNKKLSSSPSKLLKTTKSNTDYEAQLLLQITLKFPQLFLKPHYITNFTELEISDPMLKALQANLLQLLQSNWINNQENVTSSILLSALSTKVINLATNLYQAFEKDYVLPAEKAQMLWDKVSTLKKIKILEEEYQLALTDSINNIEAEKKVQGLLKEIHSLKTQLLAIADA